MARSEFLIEIGSEEIPAGYLDPALKRLETRVLGFFREHGLDFDPDGVERFATPRRLALLVRGLSTSTPLREERKLGPAVSAAFDAEGRPTRAAEGFARKLGCSVDELEEFDDPKGARLGKEIRTGGDELRELLLRAQPMRDWIQLGFPKTMRWIPGEDLSYARPIRWLVCLLGDEPIPLRLSHLEAGRETRGHRTLHGGRIRLERAVDYELALAEASVVASPLRRREIIEEEAGTLAREAGAAIHPDPGLLAEVVNLVEHPRGLMGSFEPEIAGLLPREVIITAMRAHQRYFSVESAEGEVLPRFITFRDGGDAGIENVRAGNERVLRARLDDAVFYWNEDRAASSEEKLARLDAVVWMEGFGSMGDKSRRIWDRAGRRNSTPRPSLGPDCCARATWPPR
jgi:glycyl-tRNA synthetase beta chain